MQNTEELSCLYNINGWWLRLLVTQVGVFDMSYFGKFVLAGPDAVAAMQWLCCANVDKHVGSTVYTHMLNKNGGALGTPCPHPTAPPPRRGPGLGSQTVLFYDIKCMESCAWKHRIQTVKTDRRHEGDRTAGTLALVYQS